MLQRYENGVRQDFRGHEGRGDSADATSVEDGRAGQTLERPQFWYYWHDRHRRAFAGKQAIELHTCLVFDLCMEEPCLELGSVFAAESTQIIKGTTACLQASQASAIVES